MFFYIQRLQQDNYFYQYYKFLYFCPALSCTFIRHEQTVAFESFQIPDVLCSGPSEFKGSLLLVRWESLTDVILYLDFKKPFLPIQLYTFRDIPPLTSFIDI